MVTHFPKNCGEDFVSPQTHDSRNYSNDVVSGYLRVFQFDHSNNRRIITTKKIRSSYLSPSLLHELE
jgi:hypothetical protein